MHKKQWHAVCGFVVDGCESISDSSRTMKDIFRIITEQRNSVLFRYEVNNRIVSVSRQEFQRRPVSVARKIQECVDSNHKMLGLHMKSGLEWAVVFWGILMSGHIPVILDENKELFQDKKVFINSIPGIRVDDMDEITKKLRSQHDRVVVELTE